MPTPSKFNAQTRQRILEILAAGGSRRTAAATAGVDHATLSRWLARGRDAAPGSRWREFVQAVEQAEAHPRVRALTAVYDALPDNPGLAWKFIERREPGYGPSTAVTPEAPSGPVVIQLHLPSTC